jgi:hypothetical protein
MGAKKKNAEICNRNPSEHDFSGMMKDVKHLLHITICKTESNFRRDRAGDEGKHLPCAGQNRAACAQKDDNRRPENPQQYIYRHLLGQILLRKQHGEKAARLERMRGRLPIRSVINCARTRRSKLTRNMVRMKQSAVANKARAIAQQRPRWACYTTLTSSPS